MDRTQYEIENEYYFVDLPELIEKKRKHDAVTQLRTNRATLATNSRGLEDEDYKIYSRELAKEAGLGEVKQRFDRDKFEEMRSMLGG